MNAQIDTLASAGPIPWDDALAVNNPQIDGQHRRIVDILNRLLAVRGKGSGSAPGCADPMIVLEELRDLLAEHFVTEEQLLEARNDPRLANHRMAHGALWAELAHIGREAQVVSAQALESHLTAFARKLIQDHVPHWDLQSKTYFSQEE